MQPNPQIDHQNIPSHIAVIMDGNGRWAKQKGAKRLLGHQHAITAVREVTEGCAELEVDYLTLYAFSTENWDRPRAEVDGLMSLLVATIRKEIPTLVENDVKLSCIGNVGQLPAKAQKSLKEAMQITEENKGLELILALNYSGRWDLVNAIEKMIESGETKIDAALVSANLSTAGIPDPELLIRTSGEMRISNFLLWQLAYTELYFTEVLWPDFRKEHLHQAIESYQKRERRFGKTSEQMKVKA